MPSSFQTKKILAILVIVLNSVACTAQTIKTNDGQNASVDYKKLANIDTLINGYVNRNWVGGVVTIVVKNGQVIQNKSYGYADAATKNLWKPTAFFVSLRKQKPL